MARGERRTVHLGVFANQTISGYKETMKQVMISELKAKLSSYLADVRAGQTVVVCDRRTAIARLVPFDQSADDFRVAPATDRLPSVRELPKVRMRKEMDVVAVLREDRDQR